MKKKLIIVMIALVVYMASSCNKQLNQAPITSKTSTNFTKTQSEVEEYVNAAYGELQKDGMYGLYFPALGEIPSDNTYDEVPANDNGVFGQLDLFTTIPLNSLLSAVWDSSYVCIQRANTVLNRISNITYTDSTVKQSRIGEMKFLRGLTYFNLVRVWGDVPLVTQETTDPNKYFGQGRTPKDQVYKQIEQDLTDAVSVLPVVPANPGRATRYAAQALLGKVYLTLNDWSNAKTNLQAVVDGNKYALLTDPAQVFNINNKNNAEIIFAVQFAAGVNGNTEGSPMAQQYSPSGTIANAKGHNIPTLSLYNLYANNDLRKNAYLGLTSNNVPYYKKLVVNTVNPIDGGSNFVVLRYADVLLMLAEANNEMNNISDAAKYLNMIRQRAGLNNTQASTQSTLRDSISLERRFELVGEGHRWFDLVRTGTAVSVMNAWFKANQFNITIDSHQLLQPVPQSQIDTDPSIKQNSGY